MLAIRPDLRELAETHAARFLSTEDRVIVAAHVADTLRGLDIEELNSRAGYHRGRGYVHPVEAADEILDEALEPFLHNLERRAGLGMSTATVELAVGILLGLYRCRDGGSETLLEYSPDFAVERATEVMRRCAKHGIELPSTELLDLAPEWDAVLDR